MREIKFDVIIQIKHPEEGELQFEHNPFSEALHESFVYFKDGVLLTDEEDDDHKTILRQYTGLMDKNGKEIYEGDIVTYSYYMDYGQTGEIKNRVKPVIVHWDDKQTGFYPITTWSEYREQLKHCEVIGNIYENPELLKEKI